MTRLFLFCCLLALPALVLTPHSARGGGPSQTATARGEIVGVDDNNDILTVETRLGRRDFLLTGQTEYFVNDLVGNIQDLEVGDRAAVTYDTFTFQARIVRITRKRQRSGRVISASGNAVNFRLSQGGRVTLLQDAFSRIRLEDLAVEDAAALARTRGVAVYDPSDRTLLSLKVSCNTARGQVTAVDSTTSTLAFDGNRASLFAVDDNATLRRNGVTATLAEIAPGDSGKAYFLKEGRTRRLLALVVTGPAGKK